MNRAFAFAFLVASFNSGALATEIHEVDDQNLEQMKQDMKKAWIRRAKRVQSASFAYTTRRSDKKLPYYTSAEDRPKLSQQEKEKLGKEYFQYAQHMKFSFDGWSMRYELRGQMPRDRAEIFDHDSVEVSNGKVSKHLDSSRVGVHYPTGEILKEPENPCVSLSDTLPLRWAYFGLEPRVSNIAFEKLVFEEKSLIDDKQCLHFKQQTSKSEAYHYWLDPTSEYSIVRLIIENQGRPELQVQCKFIADNIGGWLPASWVVTYLDRDGSPRSTGESVVTQHTINPKLPREQFELEFPPGTVVSDRRPQPGIGRTGSLDYVVMKDGSKRLITWDERNASYEELLATESGTAHPLHADKGGLAVTWVLVINVFIVCAVAALLGVKRILKKASRS